MGEFKVNDTRWISSHLGLPAHAMPIDMRICPRGHFGRRNGCIYLAHLLQLMGSEGHASCMRVQNLRARSQGRERAHKPGSAARVLSCGHAIRAPGDAARRVVWWLRCVRAGVFERGDARSPHPTRPARSNRACAAGSSRHAPYGRRAGEGDGQWERGSGRGTTSDVW
jgi:hypothetical protein